MATREKQIEELRQDLIYVDNIVIDENEKANALYDFNVRKVVLCRDCKYLYCFSAIDRLFYCKHTPKGLTGINIVEDNPFCSYGERRDT